MVVSWNKTLFYFQIVNAIADWVLNDPFLVSAFTQYSRSKQAISDPMMEDTDNRLIRPTNNNINMNKRNSELLNSLLGLPKNILRSGRK
jgi:hypothetical protein